MHLFRKLYINAFEYEHEIAWKSGVFTFLVLQAVTFFGLVLGLLKSDTLSKVNTYWRSLWHERIKHYIHCELLRNAQRTVTQGYLDPRG